MICKKHFSYRQKQIGAFLSHFGDTIKNKESEILKLMTLSPY